MKPVKWHACWRGFGALLLALGNAGALAAGPARVEDSAADAVYDCPVPPPEQFEARVTQLSTSTWDKNSLGCAADLMSDRTRLYLTQLICDHLRLLRP